MRGGGGGSSQVAGLANFSPYQVSGFGFKSYRFSGFEMCRWLWFWLFLMLGSVWVYYSKFLFCQVLKSYSPCS